MRKIYGLMILGIFLIWSCNENPTPSLFNPEKYDQTRENVPEITAIAPADSSYAGVGTLTITGKNFSPVEPYNDNNQVLFNNVIAEIVSMTSTEITVASPVLVGDSLSVKIWSKGIQQYSDPVNYKLKPAVQIVGGLGDVDFATALAGDGSNNIYVSVHGAFEDIIKLIIPDGTGSTYAGTSFLNANGMAYGPGNMLYCAIAAGRVKQIKTIDQAGVEATYKAVTQIPIDLDFDQDLSLWIVGRVSTTTLTPSDIVRIKADGTMETMATMDSYLKCVRIYVDGGTPYVYVAGSNSATGEKKIWRREIQGDGSLGSEQVVLDVAGSSWLNGSTVQSVTFSADGLMYIATDASPDAMFIYDPVSQSHQVLYPGLIGPRIYDIVWDEGAYIYATKQEGETSATILKIDVGKKGAPYYGRP
jgi:hypothetical protein